MHNVTSAFSIAAPFCPLMGEKAAEVAEWQPADLCGAAMGRSPCARNSMRMNTVLKAPMSCAQGEPAAAGGHRAAAGGAVRRRGAAADGGRHWRLRPHVACGARLAAGRGPGRSLAHHPAGVRAPEPRGSPRGRARCTILQCFTDCAVCVACQSTIDRPPCVGCTRSGTCTMRSTLLIAYSISEESRFSHACCSCNATCHRRRCSSSWRALWAGAWSRRRRAPTRCSTLAAEAARAAAAVCAAAAAAALQCRNEGPRECWAPTAAGGAAGAAACILCSPVM